ncbi:hypothetical protein [Deinococcus maricopensis]|uniref:Uncharacterized protein n=1 Tax=Deinococcus maricopensis (strain DSM 21211 / LMG 22137 / NRRL B-23946 / LB-34) TaxID=709986 RepID=E8U404_DEIML|nr:hypothetical protein [Deinococcus maricopensis]ADV65698.1 hypothetical protein Deima_0034 [Deinococcus maricopensis DSM 21211]
MHRALLTLTFLLGSAAGAAGLLGTTGSVANSDFCREYSCEGPTLNGPDRLYDLNTGDRLAVRYGNASRISRLSLLFDGDNLDASTDRLTIRDLQALAFGRVAKDVRPESCYGSRNVLTLAARPDPTADALTCLNDGDVTRVDITASSTYLNRPLTATPTTSAAPANELKLREWYFKNCRASTSVTGYLPVGTSSRCDLIIEITRPTPVVRAEFTYELEYTQNGQPYKTLLPGKDTWQQGRAPGTTDPRLTQNGATITANLSFNVRNVPGRRVTSINAIGTLTFQDGTVKRVYEPLQIR